MPDTQFVDPNSRFLPPVPRVLRNQVRAAEEIHRQVYGADGEPPAQPPAPEPTATTVVAQEPTQEPAQAPAQTPASTAPVDWEHRFKSLEGRFNAQTQELRDLRAANQQVFQLQSRIAELENALHAARQAPKPVAGAAPDPKDVETWGEDLLSAARRQARAELEPELQQLRSQLAAVRDTTQQVTRTAHQATIEQRLAQLVGPDWNSINYDDGFKAWLREVDPFSGNVRGQMMLAARDAGDAVRVANFFNAYKQHTASARPSAQPAHTPAGAGQVSLESLAAPGPGRQIGTGADTNRRLITQKEIAQFWSDVNRGKYRGKQAEKEAREREIFNAVSEGRVV